MGGDCLESQDFLDVGCGIYPAAGPREGIRADVRTQKWHRCGMTSSSQGLAGILNSGLWLWVANLGRLSFPEAGVLLFSESASWVLWVARQSHKGT